VALAARFVFYQAAGPFDQSINRFLVLFEPPLQARELFCHAGKFGHSLRGCLYLISGGANTFKAWSAPVDLKTNIDIEVSPTTLRLGIRL
jgi:hypothetical protein